MKKILIFSCIILLLSPICVAKENTSNFILVNLDGTYIKITPQNLHYIGIYGSKNDYYIMLKILYYNTRNNQQYMKYCSKKFKNKYEAESRLQIIINKINKAFNTTIIK
jgi:hypothetical protein